MDTAKSERDHLIRHIGASLNEQLVKWTERHDLTTREQVVALSMLFGAVIAMGHVREDLARVLGEQMVNAALEAVAAFQRDTQN